jgi:hypothetical protein
MTTMWNDFNDAKKNSTSSQGHACKVRVSIRPGGFDDPAQGWVGGYATRGTTGAVYLNTEFTVLEGPYARRKVFSMIGLYSPKGPDWANMGRSLVRGMLNSARGIADKDNSPQAQAARRINGFVDLDGLEFVARIDVGTDTNGDEKNEIRAAVTSDHKDYAALMGVIAVPAVTRQQPAPSYPAASAELSGRSPPRIAASGSGRRHPSDLGEVRAWR